MLAWCDATESGDLAMPPGQVLGALFWEQRGGALGVAKRKGLHVYKMPDGPPDPPDVIFIVTDGWKAAYSLAYVLDRMAEPKAPEA